ncbi:nuclear transport factor 2 family protein [Dietzia sp. ANT_WB102]|uniref:nuclear transport factor 2 family protein n=1 Tax=Dietzia sp. ANT_WB102 TaxID=2597345 RepID=UPI0011ECF3BC|nr:nuclear transport factor 2 family protein [Dietzia sp. ANT_WB102]KAA0916524.1 nuclear transport factor 2 family protein [Dietzia sp. ANT_WB102]
MSDERSTRSKPGQVALTFLQAVLEGDFETARAYCTSDVVLRIEGLQSTHGHEGLRDIMTFAAETSTNVRYVTHHVLGTGDSAAINRTTYMTIGGQDLTLEVGAFFTLRDGLICEWTDYQDVQSLNRALGH